MSGWPHRGGMDERTILRRLSLPDRLRVLAFDTRLTRSPEPLVAAIWEAIASLERPQPTHSVAKPAPP